MIDRAVDRMIEMFESTPERDALRDVFEGFFAKECGPERVRAAEPLGFDERLWAQLAELGVPAMASGGDAALADLAVVAPRRRASRTRPGGGGVRRDAPPRPVGRVHG